MFDGTPGTVAGDTATWTVDPTAWAQTCGSTPPSRTLRKSRPASTPLA
ncbi:hypothetical protein H1235_03490 [Pseudoxanthomonas sp. NC8]|nr:hypothetical protein H1235_03490 [Pseudoxanthomonas sp. NC8]